MRIPSAKRMLLSALVGLVAVLAISPAQADLIATPNTYRADFNLGAGFSLTRADARFIVGPSDPLVGDETFSFTLFDSPGTVIDTKVFTAGIDTGFFFELFDLGPTDLTDGIGFIEIKGVSGQFDLAGAFIHGVRSDGETTPDRELFFVLVVPPPPAPGPAPTPAPPAYALVAVGLGLLGSAARRRRNAFGRPVSRRSPLPSSNALDLGEGRK